MTTLQISSRRMKGAAALTVAGLLASACASDDPLSDPLFWQGVSIGADLVALALILDSDCYTRIDSYGYAYQVCYDDRYRDHRPRPHRPHRPRPHGPDGGPR